MHPVALTLELEKGGFGCFSREAIVHIWSKSKSAVNGSRTQHATRILIQQVYMNIEQQQGKLQHSASFL